MIERSQYCTFRSDIYSVKQRWSHGYSSWTPFGMKLSCIRFKNNVRWQHWSLMKARLFSAWFFSFQKGTQGSSAATYKLMDPIFITCSGNILHVRRIGRQTLQSTRLLNYYSTSNTVTPAMHLRTSISNISPYYLVFQGLKETPQ